MHSFHSQPLGSAAIQLSYNTHYSCLFAGPRRSVYQQMWKIALLDLRHSDVFQILSLSKKKKCIMIKHDIHIYHIFQILSLSSVIIELAQAGGTIFVHP